MAGLGEKVMENDISRLVQEQCMKTFRSHIKSSLLRQLVERESVSARGLREEKINIFSDKMAYCQ